MGETQGLSDRRAQASSRPLAEAVHALRTDANTARVVTAFRSAGIRSILLKGPAVARWLYDESERPYGDTDLLVSPGDLAGAEAVLSSLGFEHPPLDDLTGDRPWHAHAWFNWTDNVGVDLHRTLVGARAAHELVWGTLAERTETIDLHGVGVEILAPPARALHVALHAAQDGRPHAKAQADLARAVEQLDEDTWVAAAGVGERLDALEAFGVGLRRLAPGAALAHHLDLPEPSSMEVLLRAQAAPQLALSLEWVAQQPGLLSKLKLMARKLVPPRAFMEAWSPLARRGSLGLLAAHGARLTKLLVRLGPSFSAWRSARRRARAS